MLRDIEKLITDGARLADAARVSQENWDMREKALRSHAIHPNKRSISVSNTRIPVSCQAQEFHTEFLVNAHFCYAMITDRR